MKILIKTALASAVISILTACGGSTEESSPTAELTFAVSDNPANVQAVVIAFKSVAIKKVNDDGDAEEGEAEQTIRVQDNNAENTDYRQVDLIKFQGSNAQELFRDITLEPGDYQMCIYITDGIGNNENTDSYVIEKDGSRKGLSTNSNGSCAGFKPDDELATGRLKTTTFTIHEGKNYIVAEFDLMKVLKEPAGNSHDGNWTLKPTGYELVHVDNVGSISGNVSEQVKANCEGAVGGSEFAYSVYLYPTTLLTNMGDFRIEHPNIGYLSPIASARVNEVETVWSYEFGFVEAGSYSIGYTCTAQLDDPELSDPSPIYLAGPDVEVIAGETVTADIEIEL
ncbi:DUF4382 domain-containing protein [Psychromonas hadalis]|uniref:DUF4382 domain-containing protein n=1 Tax=Psychromonas hadalis TaxID=211669 RepID=UPI0003B7825E|nr:DUF4382 domain-containing protein [Psychromonas hadalis]